MGQAGVYILTDPAEDALGLPSGYGKYDVPLVLSSKTYKSDGTLLSTHGEDESLWGDVIHVVSKHKMTDPTVIHPNADTSLRMANLGRFSMLSLASTVFASSMPLSLGHLLSILP
jgi:hypothetical protein